MSKNIIIGPAGEEVTYRNVSVIQTPLLEGEMCNWVPEDEAVGTGAGGNVIQDGDTLILSADGNVIKLITGIFNNSGTFYPENNTAYSSVIINI